MKECNLPCFKVRGKLLVRKSEFDKWIEGFRVKQDKQKDIVNEVMEKLKSDKQSDRHRC